MTSSAIIDYHVTLKASFGARFQSINEEEIIGKFIFAIFNSNYETFLLKELLQASQKDFRLSERSKGVVVEHYWQLLALCSHGYQGYTCSFMGNCNRRNGFQAIS